MGDAKESDEIKLATTAGKSVLGPKMPACPNPKRKLEPDFLQVVKDMNLLIESSPVEQSQALARGLVAQMTETASRRLSSVK